MPDTQTAIRPANRSITWTGAGVDELTRALECVLGVVVIEGPLYIASPKTAGFYLSRRPSHGWTLHAGQSVKILAALIQVWLEGLTIAQKCQMSGQSPPDRAAVMHNGFSVKTTLIWVDSDFEDTVVVTPAWV